MATTKQIMNWLTDYAPWDTAESWDPVGKQVFFEEKVTGVVFTMDVTDEAIAYGKKMGANVILSHHPFLFTPIKRLEEGNYLTDNLLYLLDSRTSVISAHTNLDRAEEGVNQSLAETLGMKDTEGLTDDLIHGPMGLVGTVKPCTLEEFTGLIRKTLDPLSLTGWGRRVKNIQRVALCGGSGSEFMAEALAKDADVYVTGDMKYHDGQWAYEQGLCVLDIGHFDSEKMVLPLWEENFKKVFPEVDTFLFSRNLFQWRIEE